MAEEMPLRTHELMRMIQLDRRDRIFRDESIWLCLTCETCSERCPNGVDPAGAIDPCAAWPRTRNARDFSTADPHLPRSLPWARSKARAGSTKWPFAAHKLEKRGVVR